MTALFGVILGLCLIYLVFAIVVSGVQEWIAQWRGSRGKFLRIGLSRLINDDAIFVRLLHHPLVGGLYRDRAARGKPPSYVDPNNLALALANLVVRRANPPQTQIAATDSPQQGTAWAAAPLTWENLRAALQNLAAERSSLATALLPIVDQCRNDLPHALKGIEQWYSSGMDRVSGWYKAHAQKSLFAIGLLLALLANVDSIEIFRTLNRSADLRAQLSQLASGVAHSGKIGDVDVAALRDRPPTNAEWTSILATSLDETDATGAGRLPIGYSCLRAFVAVASSERGAVTAAATDPLPVNRDPASQSPVAGHASVPAGSTSPSTKSRSKSAWSTCAEQLSVVGRTASPADFLLKLVGCAITALAGVLGAPYWFSALSKVVQIRGSGPKPTATR